MMATAKSRDVAREHFASEADLLKESTFGEAGEGPVVAVGDDWSRGLQITLEITRAVACSSLRLSICGSPDGLVWDPRPLLCLPHKYYCGTYRSQLDLSNRPEVRYVKAAWSIRRLGQNVREPVFTFQVNARSAA